MAEWSTEKKIDLVELERWRDAVELEAARATSKPENAHDIEPDVFFLTISACLLFRSAHRASCRHPAARSNIDKAKTAFTKRLGGDLKRERDIISHFDDYVRGEGKEDLGILSPLAYEADDGNVYVKIADGVVVSVREVHEASKALYVEARKALLDA
jgi:hypothetical protein